MCLGKRQGARVRRGEQLLLPRVAASPDRADGVDDMARLEAVAARDLGLARVAAAERAALREQLGARGAMDGAIHAAPAEQRGVGGVDDGVDRRAW